MLLVLPSSADGQSVPADLTTIPKVPTDYAPARTAWGDPDFRGTWPISTIWDSGIPVERPKELGNRAWLNEEEFAKRLKDAKASDAAFANKLDDEGTQGMAKWLESTDFGHRNSLLVDPPDGRFPAPTAEADALHKAGRSSWVKGQTRDWVDDFDIFDRCVTRGFPASMFPYPYNNGIRIFQAPGFVVIDHEMMATRIIPIGARSRWPATVHAWMGSSRGHWEGNALVIETTNIVPGDDASKDLTRRAASPNGPRDTTYPTSEQARVIERLTMVRRDRIIYEVTYSDPKVYQASWTARIDWTRNDNYQFFEFACHEGNVQIRDMINASRAQRKLDAETANSGK